MSLRAPDGPTSAVAGVRRRRRTLRRLPVTVAAAAAVLLGAALGQPAVATGAGQPAADPAALRAATQIAALQRVKASLTPAQRKLDSHLALDVQERARPDLAAAAPRVEPDVAVDPAGRTLVDVRVAAVTPSLLRRLRGAGAVVRYASGHERSVRAAVPVGALDRVAGWPDVRSVVRAVPALTAHEVAPGAAAIAVPGALSTLPLSETAKQQRAARLGVALRRALRARPRAAAPTLDGEGDRTHAADTARATMHVTGIGIRVCALSDGVDSLAAAQAARELPAVSVLAGQAGSGDEGTAILEIVHDLAPGAALGFATGFASEAGFADNIRALRSQQHCDILVDDLGYFDESPFQDGPAARAVNDVVASGADYFSSAGNNGNTRDGTAGTYQHLFEGSGLQIGKYAGEAHDFDPGAGVQVLDPVSDESAGLPATLFWSDPLQHATDDYDLYAVASDGSVVAFSQDTQNGTQDPYEALGLPTQGRTGMSLAVVKYAGTAQQIYLQVIRGRFQDRPAAGAIPALTAYAGEGALRGHAAAAGAFAVAAAPAHDPLPFDIQPGDPPNPAGPYPGVFTAAQLPERFTSDGPRRMYFDASGRPDVVTRRKPEIAAADGVRTSVLGYESFYGTSAAAPHAAAIAALIRSGNPGMSQRDLRDALEQTALDLTPGGIDARTGHGLLRADLALAATGATPQPRVVAGTPSLSMLTGDGDAYLEPGESARLSIPERNTGDGTATGVSLRIRAVDPRVHLSAGSAAYGSIAPGRTASASVVITLAKDYPLGQAVAFRTQTSFAGALSPTTATLSRPSGQPSATFADFPYAGPPVPIPDGDPTGVSLPVAVTYAGRASSVEVSVDGTACTTDAASTTVGLDHTYLGDLVGTVTAPDGRTATLFANAGGGGHNLCQARFTDRATTPLADATPDRAPFTGSWKPAQPLSSMPQQVTGTWHVTVADTAPGDTGTVRAVSLHVAGYDAP